MGSPSIESEKLEVDFGKLKRALNTKLNVAQDILVNLKPLVLSVMEYERKKDVTSLTGTDLFISIFERYDNRISEDEVFAAACLLSKEGKLEHDVDQYYFSRFSLPEGHSYEPIPYRK